jgi:protein phosphatase
MVHLQGRSDPVTQLDLDQPSLPLASPPPVQAFGLTDPGKVRMTNQDHFLIAELVRALWIHQTSLPQSEMRYGRNRGHIFLVADGMGGHRGGGVASALTVSTIETFVLHVLKRFSNLQTTDEQGVLKDLQTALCQADARLNEESVQHPQFTGMGTTLTMAFVSGWKLFVIHAGDSRCYLFRRGNLRQLTCDHTVVGELLRRGIIKRENAGHHQYRHVVTNILGGGSVGVQADVVRTDLEPGDAVLLCSDGLTDMLDDAQIAAILGDERNSQSACERLVAEANERGGEDNITAVVVHFGDR